MVNQVTKKKVVKLAVLRDNKQDKCPFGLKIPWSCSNAGTVITKMAPLKVLDDEATEKERYSIALANARLLAWSNPGVRCAYAGKIFKDKNMVECNWGSNAPGVSQDHALQSSPYYSRVYNTTTIDGLYSYPLGWYGDNNISRNLYYGIYSLQGGSKPRDLEKFAKYLGDLDKEFESLPEEVQVLLVDFASTYANNASLIKKATSLPLVNDISLILERWKEKNDFR